MTRQQDPQSREAELLQGTLDLLILKVVALEPIHGYAIAQRIQQISREALQIRQGSLYPALHRLENRGWLEARWETTDSGRKAKFYSLSKVGRAQLEVETGAWERLCEAIALVLRAEAGELQ
ncbi:MAG: PadR family transcriptional regulator [Acidobacteria bacterium]|nr:PadR family transcriptional regulator [Acidobacteriota bacterium]